MFGFEPVLCCDVWYVLCYVRKNHLLECFAITDRRDIGLYDVPILMSYVRFRDRYDVGQFSKHEVSCCR